MTDPARYLGVDIGSTATKAIAFTENGTALHAGSATYPTARPRPDHVEQDAADWTASVDQAVAQIAAVIDLSGVVGIGITSQVDTHLPVDAQLTPLRPAILWQDVRCGAEVQSLTEQLGPAGLARPDGDPAPVDASNPAPRALWLQRHEPQLWDRCRWLLLPKDYVNAWLTGEVSTDPQGSFKVVGRNGLYLPGVRAVDGLAERLPPLRDPDEAVGRTRRPWHGIPAGTVVATATMDGMGNVLGSGLREPGDAMAIIGTSVIVGAIGVGGTGGPGVVDFVPFRGRQVHAGPTQSGGDTLRWWANATGHTVQEVVDAAATAAPGSAGVVHAPHLLGERAPLWDDKVRGWFTGLHPGAGFAELSRSVLEGVALSARELVDAVEVAAGAPVRDLVVSGGGSRSPLWCQILADTTGRTVRRSDEADTAVVGAGALASAAHSGADPWVTASRLVHHDLECRPDPVVAELMAERYHEYRSAYRLLVPLHEDMAASRRDIAGRPA